MGKINVIRPDGTVIQATEEQASRLEVLGYKRETPEENEARLAEVARDNYYSAPLEKAQAAVEGFASGASLGLTDYLGDDSTKARAQYNPGTRKATEILGALVPLALSGGASTASTAAGAAELSAGARLASITPAGLVGRAGAALGKGGGYTATALRGAVEGAAFSGAAAADHAYLSGDPVTSETVLHGMGWGAVFGAGLSVAGEAVATVGRNAAVRTAARKAEAAKSAVTEKAWLEAGEGAFQPLAAEVQGLRGTLSSAVAGTDTMVDDILSKSFGPTMTAEQSVIASGLKKSWSRAHKAIAGNDLVKAEEAIKRFADDLSMLRKGMDGLPEIEAQVAAYRQSLGAGKIGGPNVEATVKAYRQQLMEQMPSPIDTGAIITQLREVGDMRAVAAALDKFPTTMAGFKALTPEKAETLFAALERGSKITGMETLTAEAEAAAGKLSEFLGIQGSSLRTAHQAVRDMKFGAETVTPAGRDGKPGVVSRLLGRAAGAKVYTVARGIGAGPIAARQAAGQAADMVSHIGIGRALVDLKNWTVARIDSAAARYLPGAGKDIARKGPSALAITLDGGVDKSTTDRRQLAKNRIDEFLRAAPNIDNTLYAGVEPLMGSQPDLMPGVHKSAATAFKSMVNVLPRSPGAMSGLQDYWQPSDVEALVLEKQLAVFQDPVAAAERMLDTGEFDPITTDALKRTAPEIYSQLRFKVLERVSDPAVMAKTSYGDQVALSMLLDIPVHSSMEPRSIASSQQMFLDRNQPAPMPTNPATNPGGRPAGDNPNATASQKVTER